MQLGVRPLSRPWHHQFTQKRLQAWQPILTPAFTIPFYLICGVLFLLIGVVLLLTASNQWERVFDYTDNPTDGNSVGHFEIELKEDVQPPLWIHYELSGFYQNHRRYVKSYDAEQLSTGRCLLKDACQQCTPASTGPDGRKLYPCGLIATSVFNDSFVVVKRTAGSEAWQPVDVDSGAETIAWPADLQGRFRNMDPEAMNEDSGLITQAELDMWLLRTYPPVECMQRNFSADQPWVPATIATRKEAIPAADKASAPSVVEVADCTGYMTGQPTCNYTRLGQPFSCENGYEQVHRRSWGIESGHFIVWMRVAGLPNFRKPWGKVNEPLPAGTVLKIYFLDHFPAKTFHGRKALVFSTAVSVGGKDDFLGYGFIAVGVSCLVFGLWKFLQCVYAPRQLGDISFLTPHR